MIVQALAFYLFAGIAIAASVMVIVSRNPVHSVLFLIMAFFNSAALFVLLGAEFLAMILIVVYVGAVAVLFLFVVMMLDVNFAKLREGFQNYLPIGGLIGLILLIELVFVVGAWIVVPQAEVIARDPVPADPEITNTEALGRILYTDYAYLFQVSGLVLLVAMIGAIVLTLRQRTGVRRQNVEHQIARRREDTVAIARVDSGKGV